MTRGRKPATPVDVLEPEIDQERFAEAMDAMRTDESSAQLVISQRQAGIRAVALQVGYQLPADCTDPDIIQRDIAANMRRSVEACLEVGRGLAVLRQACEHGQFLARLEALGIETRVAQRFMQSAVKFSNASTSTHFAKAIGSPSKLFELLVLDNDQAEELTLTGQTGELKLDDIASMSVKELRAALREAREEEKAKAELLSEKNRLLDAERAKVKRIQALPKDEVAAHLLAEAAGHFNGTLACLAGQFRAALICVTDHHATAGGDSTQVLAGYVARLQQELVALREEFNLPDTFGDGTPEWMRATADDQDLADC